MPTCVLMVTDFFYPNFGGVENHVYQLSQCLLQLDYKVVIVTHAYGDCKGVRYLTNGLKVYYLYRRPLYLQSTAPTVFGSMRILRVIMLRECVHIVHAHQAFSTLGLEACLHARTMGYKVVFTDHSLFGFADVPSILMNQLLKCVLCDVHHVICVSHTSKENTVLRANLNASAVSVIPNAVNAADFLPAPPSISRPRNGLRDRVVVVALSRLVYRKGIDLMALVIPYICATHPNVDFIIGGGGPKSALLEAMVADHGLEGRVSLCGPVPNEKARDFLLQGHIFLNASLTEAFCIAIVEAAACGLLIVSTRVGGVPEVLPPDMVELAEPSAEGLCAALRQALKRLGDVEPFKQHARVASMYSWPDVAKRTTAVYDRVVAEWCPQCGASPSVGRHVPLSPLAKEVVHEGQVVGTREPSSQQAQDLQQQILGQQARIPGQQDQIPDQRVQVQGRARLPQQRQGRQPRVLQRQLLHRQQVQDQNRSSPCGNLTKHDGESRQETTALRNANGSKNGRAPSDGYRLCLPLSVLPHDPVPQPARSTMQQTQKASAVASGGPAHPAAATPLLVYTQLAASHSPSLTRSTSSGEKQQHNAERSGHQGGQAVVGDPSSSDCSLGKGLESCCCCCCCHASYYRAAPCSEAAAYLRATEGGLLLARLACYRRCGFLAGLLFGALAVAVHLWWCCLQWLQPAHKIQAALDFPAERRRGAD
ncbi:hypothetical protein DUNSADRAFT_1639 [Dunaliella salina]|uniref:phosphatidylinositol N-acetylglucosaminyltransferase n=1 Tax=Dunaliella salina TaxID=3046 RepID=A0ABQ7GWW0_DUNSA|nr:hypothetical protein DUNSADRAFT_1639 [Dunaliella salina]|eukprot:KAF5839094.1 hypothetical protein DUNSADRAFT_1639 [Dunaliella salina]